MSERTAGQAGRPEEAQCYNCGSMGHWAIACPEPTRQTPAGLTAWRNSSSSAQPSSKSNNSNGSKRSKAPIITKYAAPAPPVYGHGMSNLPPIPPPPGQHHHSASSYPGSAHPYPTYPPPPPSSASYAPGYAPSGYGYPPPQFSPPPPPGSSSFAPPGYGRPPPPLGPPPGGHFSPGRPDGQEHRSPPSFDSGFAHSQSSPPASTRQPQAPGTIPSKAHTESQPPKPASLPPKPPTARIAHPLPPKPPKSLDQVDNQRDSKTRRKHDRNKPKDKRPKDQHASRHSIEMIHRENQHSPPSDSNGLGLRQNGPGHHHDSPERSSTAQRPRLPSGDSQASARRSSHSTTRKVSPPGRTKSRPEVELRTESAGDRDAGDRKYSVDDGLERGDRPNLVPPTAAQRNTFRPRTSSQGSRGRTLPETSSQSDNTPHAAKDESEERKSKRRKTLSSPESESKRPRTDDGTECVWDAIDVPREADRRQAEKNRPSAKHRGSTGSRASKHSSVSSQSSDLNSLEAELLGRPAKPKSPEKSNTRHRPEPSINSLKPKRRQANSNSAFSRRW